MVVTAEPNASIGFAQAMLQRRPQACAPANLQKTLTYSPSGQLDPPEQLIDALCASLTVPKRRFSAAPCACSSSSPRYAGVGKARKAQEGANHNEI